MNLCSFCCTFFCGQGSPMPAIIGNGLINGIVGSSYGNMYNVNHSLAGSVFAIASIARNIFRLIAAVAMVKTINTSNNFVRAKILLDLTTYSMSILAFRLFGLIGNPGTLALSGLAALLILKNNFKYFTSTGVIEADNFKDKIQRGDLEILFSAF